MSPSLPSGPGASSFPNNAFSSKVRCCDYKFNREKGQTFLGALAALYLHMGLINSPFMIQSDRRVNAFVQIFPTSLVRQVGGYMRPDNLQLACVLPYKHDGHHGRHGHHGCHGHHGHHG